MSSPESADAIVVGGGPAGCTVAILLKQSNPNARIILFEKDKFPRHHVGESMLPDANAVLSKLGIIDSLNQAGFPIKCGLTYKWRHDRPIFSDLFATGVHPKLQDRLYPKGIPEHSWQIERGRYDRILLERAREVGIEVHEETRVVGFLFEQLADEVLVKGVRVEDAEGTIRSVAARHTVDASGQGRKISSFLGIQVEKFPLGDTALYRYYKGFTWSQELIGSFYNGKIFFASVPRGWMWFIPISNDTASVGLVTRKEFLRDVSTDQAFEEDLKSVPEMCAMLHDAIQVSHEYDTKPPSTYAVQDWTYRNTRFAGPGWYLVGDAAAFVDPILSSGLNLAHNCGLLVANAINTEWNYPEVPATEVREGYATLYRGIYNSFLAMAAWWYERRHTNIDDWWKVARQQSRNQSAVANLSDRQVFLTFTAGYVTDFRYINIGAGGFGAQGLNALFDHLPEVPIEEKMHRPELGMEEPLLPTFDRYEMGSYFGSHVGTDRWWKLPLVRFYRGDESSSFYPSIMESEDETEALLADTSERIVLCTLAHIDGKRGARQVAQALQKDFGGFDQKLHRCAMKLIHNLITVGWLSIRT